MYNSFVVIDSEKYKILIINSLTKTEQNENS